MGKDLHRRLRIVRDADRLVDFEGHARQLFGFCVASFFNKNCCEAHHVSRRHRVVLPRVLEPGQQGAAGVDLGFPQSSLPRLHAGLAEDGAIDRLQKQRFRWRIIGIEHRLHARVFALLSDTISGFGLTELPARLENNCTIEINLGFPAMTEFGIGSTPSWHATGPCFLDQGHAAA